VLGGRLCSGCGAESFQVLSHGLCRSGSLQPGAQKLSQGCGTFGAAKVVLVPLGT